MQTMVEQFAKLRAKQPDIPGFYRQSIELIADRIDAQAIMVWDCSSLPYQPIQQFNRESGDAIRVGISQQQHVELLQRAAAQEKVILSATDRLNESGSSHLMLCPVKRGNDQTDLIEVFVKANQPGSLYVRSKAELKNCCDAISDSLQSHPNALVPPDRPASQPAFELDRFEQFADNVHQSIDPRRTCFHIANEAQSLLGCDRVTVMRFERKAKTIAISGLPRFNRRANAITALEKLATTVLKTGQWFWYPEDDALPQISERLDRYLTEGVTRSLVVVPIFQCRKDTRLSPEEIRFETANPVIGALVFENFSGQWQKESMTEPVTMIGRHASSAFRNAARHRELFLYPVWRSLGKLKSLTTPRHLSKTVVALVLLVLLVASLFLVPSRMTVSGDGKLVPRERRTVFAQVGGQVETIHVEHGAAVGEGQPLLQLTSSELEIRLNEIENRIELAKKQIESLDSRRMSSVGARTPEETEQEDLEHASLLSQLESYKNERTIYQLELDRLTVSSPIAGQVISANLHELLMDRPVQPGQVLMEVANVDGQWIVEMNLPDRRIGHLRRAQQELGADLRATFILSADPGRRLTGTVYEVALSTQVHPESGQSIRVKIRLDNPDALDIRQVDTDVKVRIDCGECSLGYSLFRDLGEFFQSRVLFFFQ